MSKATTEPRKWMRAKVVTKTYPFYKQNETVWVTKNDLMADRFLKPNTVVLQPELDLKHHCFMTKTVLPHYFQAGGVETQSKKIAELDKAWKHIAKHSR